MLLIAIYSNQSSQVASFLCSFTSLSVHFKNILKLGSKFKKKKKKYLCCSAPQPYSVLITLKCHICTSKSVHFAIFSGSLGVFKITFRSDYIMSFLMLPINWNVISINFYSFHALWAASHSLPFRPRVCRSSNFPTALCTSAVVVAQLDKDFGEDAGCTPWGLYWHIR